MAVRWHGARGLCFVIGLLLFACSPAYGDAKSNLAFVDASTVTLPPDAAGTFKLELPLKNAGNSDAAGWLELLDETDARCSKIAPQRISKLAPSGVMVEHLVLSNVKLPATCYLVLTTDGGDVSIKQIKLSQHYATSAVVTPLRWCFYISLIVAALVWCVAGVNLGGMAPWFILGAPAWDFAKSWASTTTVVGGVFTTALTLSALPDLTRYASKTGYSTLALLISLVVAVAPFVYVALRRGRIESDATARTYIVVSEGCLWSFLLSCALTLFAAMAQLVLLSVLLHEVFRDYGFWSFSDDKDPWSANIGAIATWVLGAVLCWYAGYSMYLTIKLQKNADKDAVEAKRARHTVDPKLAKQEGPPENAKGPRLTWPVL